jgi:L-fuconolactonase
MMRVDSHQHFWRLSRGDYRWLRADEPAVAALVRDFLPEHLLPALQAGAVSRTLLVQAADSVEETGFLLELAARCEWIGGVVGWVDLSSPGAVHTLEGWARHAKFKGVRPMLQDLPDDDWIVRASRPDVVRTLIRLGLRFDALVKPRHLPSLLRFAQTWGGLPVVIDHAAKPQLPVDMGDDGMLAWHRYMAELAALPQVSCKFSGLLTEMPPAARTSGASVVETLRPVWRHLLRCFGPARLMWGSDWPVLNLAGDYAAWLAASAALVDELPPSDQALVWHGSAQRFYGLL